jgi:hypothetical protein
MLIISIRNLALVGLIYSASISIAVAQTPDPERLSVSVMRLDGTACDQSEASKPICVERGEERPLIDAAGWVFGIPRKVLLWDRRAHNHAVSDQTVGEVTNYLANENLGSTVVRVNQYAPIKEWQRLASNDKIAPGWRYTVGSLKWLKYTLVPGRLFGKDEYNPYTNSVYLYSDMPMLGLAEAAYAKDVSRRERPGTYAAVQELPFVALWHETNATDEVIQYVSIHGSSEEMHKVRHDLYARFGIETAGVVSQVLPDGSGLFAIIGTLAGHTTATIENRKQ